MPNAKSNACLMNQQGLTSFGYFDQAMDLGLSQFQYFNNMDKPANRLSRYFNYKQFQFVSINSGDYIIGVAIADIRYLGNGFCYVYDVKNNTLLEENWLRPPKLGYQTTPSPVDGAAFIGTEKNHIHINIVNGQWQLIINTAHLSVDVTISPSDESLPLALSSPTAYNGWTYTQKHNALTVEGQLLVNNEPQDLSQALAGYDFSAGYMRRETSWRWASINTYLTDGTKLGLNLATGVNESGFSENCCWLDGQRYYLPAVHFDFQRQRSKEQNNSPWFITSHEKTAAGNAVVELSFEPLNCRQERLNLYVLKSNFRQYIGYYSGVIYTPDGNKIMIDKLLGLSEDHFARW